MEERASERWCQASAISAVERVALAAARVYQNMPSLLTMDTTASNFARAQSDAKKEDIAVGLIHMVLQSIGSAAWLASLGSDIRDFVLIGNLSLLPQCKEVFPALETLYNIRFHIPKYSQYCTAIGAALDYTTNKK